MISLLYVSTDFNQIILVQRHMIASFIPEWVFSYGSLLILKVIVLLEDVLNRFVSIYFVTSCQTPLAPSPQHSR